MKLLFDLFISFLRIGLFTIGGGMAMIPLIRKTVVADKKWLTEEEMLDCIALAQSLPGVIAINAATYIGARQKKLAGSLAATAGVMLPSFVIIIIAALILNHVDENAYVISAFTAIKAAFCGLLVCTALTIGRKAVRGWLSWVLAVAAFVAAAVFEVSIVWIILSAAAAGIIAVLAAAWRQRRAARKQVRPNPEGGGEKP